MSEFFDHLHRNLAEAARERRKVQEEQGKKRKLQIQNSDQDQIRPKKRSIGHEPMDTSNDENRNFYGNHSTEEANDFDDDLKTVLQRRRQMLAMSKELKEKREIQAQQQQLEQKRILALEKVEQNYQEALMNFQNGFRLEPLGYDREHRRYWFFRGFAGIFVESGFFDENEKNEWFVFDDLDSIKELMNHLDRRGVREENLFINLKKIYPSIVEEFEQKRKSKTTLETSFECDEDFKSETVDLFRSELEDIESRLRLGSLGGLNTPKEVQRWQEKVRKAVSQRDLSDLLIELKRTVSEKYFSEFDSFDEKNPSENWTRDCRSCKNYSRLFVLMMVFENSITWNKSPVGMKCKICRKKRNDESIVVCDQCFYAFHLECFRSSNKLGRTSTSERWFCPSCRPENKSKRREQKFHIEDDQICCVCQSSDDLFQCNQCQLFYHSFCHQPALRVPPKNNSWICSQCRNENVQR